MKKFLFVVLVAVVCLFLLVGDAFAFGRRCRGRGCSAGSCGVAARPAAFAPSCPTGSCGAAPAFGGFPGVMPGGTPQAPAGNCPGGVCRPAGGYILR